MTTTCPAIAGTHLFALDGVCRNCGTYDPDHDKTGARSL
jgi:hypothetical protein